MFYAAFLIKPHKNVAIPVNWVYQHDKQWPKFVNMGLNPNQKHRVFFTDKWIENREPIQNYVPDFDLDAEKSPDEGCYEENY